LYTIVKIGHNKRKKDVEVDEEEPNQEVPQVEADQGDVPVDDEVAFSWQASEYVHHHKGVGWYMILLAVALILLAAAVLLHFWLGLGLVVAGGSAIAVYAHKPPRTLTYELTSGGITIEGRTYPFQDFRSFGVLPETEWHTIDLLPSRRFRPSIAVLFNPTDLDEIVDHLEQHLPRIDQRPDVIDQVSQYLRF
jgi:hypothetical protein